MYPLFNSTSYLALSIRQAQLKVFVVWVKRNETKNLFGEPVSKTKKSDIK